MEKLNLICVDDQREVLSAVVQDLEPLASWLNIEDCESAQEVLDLIDELDAEGEHITVIVSDHVMPGKTGVELLTDVFHDSSFTEYKEILTLRAGHSYRYHQSTINAAGSTTVT
eukprot:TRINITY_DN6491_c0_g1_i1.p1 TRINITY_DN6491_c0_g1~~TRINITY_DN6491_c0_g1_i1.p1  ORF type:complete len:114 (-),score=1.30 TRINITY_DN6491_c0_g1_i1:22-363(-)